MISTLKEKESGSGNDVDSAELSLYMMQVIKELNDERKLPAVHVYLCTLHSFVRFSDGGELLMSVVFTPGRLKEYETWLLGRQLSLHTVSTYLRTLLSLIHISEPTRPY